MRKTTLVLCLAALALGTAFADHPDTMGIGLVAGGNYGSSGAGSDIGLALKLPNMPIYWGLSARLSTWGIGIGATGDYYFIDDNLLKEGSFALDWFLGVGGYARLGFWLSGMAASVGARVPVGLSWHITPEFELWLGLAPSLGLSISPLNFPDWSVPGELGIRMWLK
jgi:hypothetical protein